MMGDPKSVIKAKEVAHRKEEDAKKIGNNGGSKKNDTKVTVQHDSGGAYVIRKGRKAHLRPA